MVRWNKLDGSVSDVHFEMHTQNRAWECKRYDYHTPLAIGAILARDGGRWRFIQTVYSWKCSVTYKECNLQKQGHNGIFGKELLIFRMLALKIWFWIHQKFRRRWLCGDIAYNILIPQVIASMMQRTHCSAIASTQCWWYVNFSGNGLRETIQTQLSNSGVHSDGLAGKTFKYVLDSKAYATNKKCFDNYKRFKSFGVSKGFPYKPAISIHVAIYLTYLLDSKAKFHIISATFYSIKWFRAINDVQNPSLNNWVKSLLEAGKRLTSVPVKKKDTSHLMRLWHFSSSKNSFFKRACAAI